MSSLIIFSTKTDGEEVAAACREFGVEAIAVKADVSKLADAEHLTNAAIEKFGGVDLLVANAGIWEGAPVERNVGKALGQSFGREFERNVDGLQNGQRSVSKSKIRAISSSFRQPPDSAAKPDIQITPHQKADKFHLPKRLSNELAPTYSRQLRRAGLG